MTRHSIPATQRCAWCWKSFDTVTERKTHEHLLHRANLARTQEAEAHARMQHYHADRMAVLRGRAPAP
ncbi:hypothetical protein [Teichococcus vastitatis]|uniref:hypothetical protein n=1 Tax=Teichococcus vastitatis TaxID=2307076 RepID=UPI000E7697CC|nr:hypothetical protein [Pseudoroseomonas vastitatis]